MDKSKIELIRRECEQLFFNIAWLTDHGPHQDIAMLFTEDGEFDRDGVLIKGRGELIDLYAKRPISLMTRHLVSNTSDGWKVSRRVMKMMIQLNNQGNS